MLFVLSILFHLQAITGLSAETCNKDPIFEAQTAKEMFTQDCRPVFDVTKKQCPVFKTEMSPSSESDLPRVSNILKQHSPDVQNLSVVTEEEVQSLFKELKSDCRIPFDFYIEGCSPRAHAMAKVLHDKQINVAKVFFKGDIRFPSPYKKTETPFSMHAAVVMAVKDGSGNLSPWVIDPSIAKRAMPLEEYKNIISYSPKSLTVQYTSPYRYFPFEEYQTGKHSHPYEWLGCHKTKVRLELGDYSRALNAFKSGRCHDVYSALRDNPNSMAIFQECMAVHPR